LAAFSDETLQRIQRHFGPAPTLIQRLRTFATIALAILLLATPTSGCRTTENSSSASEADEDSDDAEDSDTESGDSASDDEHPQPRSTSAWDTRKLLMANRATINHEAVQTCRDSLTALTTNAESQEDMLRAVETVLPLVARDSGTWHWCFFHLVVTLDERMERGGSLFEELAPAFFDTMRKLWVLSVALDKHDEGNTYFKFMRRRYIDMSRDWFGRRVDVVGPPMKGFTGSGPDNKPAGRVPVDAR